MATYPAHQQNRLSFVIMTAISHFDLIIKQRTHCTNSIYLSFFEFLFKSNVSEISFDHVIRKLLRMA
mgnify:CR=1 FL=1